MLFAQLLLNHALGPTSTVLDERSQAHDAQDCQAAPAHRVEDQKCGDEQLERDLDQPRKEVSQSKQSVRIVHHNIVDLTVRVFVERRAHSENFSEENHFQRVVSEVPWEETLVR